MVLQLQDIVFAPKETTWLFASQKTGHEPFEDGVGLDDLNASYSSP